MITPRTPTPPSPADVDLTAIRERHGADESLVAALQTEFDTHPAATWARLHNDRATLLRIVTACEKWHAEVSPGVPFEEELAHLEGRGPDPFHKECRATLLAAVAAYQAKTETPPERMRAAFISAAVGIRDLIAKWDSIDGELREHYLTDIDWLISTTREQTENAEASPGGGGEEPSK